MFTGLGRSGSLSSHISRLGSGATPPKRTRTFNPPVQPDREDDDDRNLCCPSLFLLSKAGFKWYLAYGVWTYKSFFLPLKTPRLIGSQKEGKPFQRSGEDLDSVGGGVGGIAKGRIQVCPRSKGTHSSSPD